MFRLNYFLLNLLRLLYYGIVGVSLKEFRCYQDFGRLLHLILMISFIFALYFLNAFPQNLAYLFFENLSWGCIFSEVYETIKLLKFDNTFVFLIFSIARAFVVYFYLFFSFNFFSKRLFYSWFLFFWWLGRWHQFFLVGFCSL